MLYALVAQWIERRRPKAGVAGSNPAQGTMENNTAHLGGYYFARCFVPGFEPRFGHQVVTRRSWLRA